MKILTAQQLRELDRFTMENEPISSIELMERAATSGFYLLDEIHQEMVSVVYVCGKGNNGGDGLVMARLEPSDWGEVTVVVLEHMDEGSPDWAQNLYRLSEESDVKVIHVRSAEDFPEVAEDVTIVDAILGTGLSRPLDGLLAEAVMWINSLPNTVISIDIPTGLFAEDNRDNDLDRVVKADHTLTFHCPKLSFLLPETGHLAGSLKVVDIGLMATGIDMEAPYEYVDDLELRKLLKPRSKFSHKGTYGHALMVAGSKGKMGAAQLAVKACFRAGAGLVTAHVPTCGLDIMQLGVEEAMCSVDTHQYFISHLPELESFNAIGIGPGIGLEKETANVLKRLLNYAKANLVLDADALNILSENKAWLSMLPKGTILTPHPKEFERLAGGWTNSFERLELQSGFSKEYGVITVFKGGHTTITTPAGRILFNSTGNPGMATAGSGDVLTGIILGLLARGYEPEDAAVLGVWLHGKAGDEAASIIGKESLTAGDIYRNLHLAFKHLESIDADHSSRHDHFDTF